VYELTADERTRVIADITRMLEAGALKHNIAASFPLADIVKAHETVESGKIAGNVVIAL
jgi:NADPH2:quinone reductase